MKLYQVDAFTDVPFKGNPAGVHIGQDMLDAKFMQQIASEMNLAETAFVFNEASGYAIRFFTPTQEVPICGHATLSAAHIMYELGLVPLHQKISFSSKSGILSVQKQDHWYVLDFPKYESVQEGDHAAFSQDTGIESAEWYKSSNGWYVAILDSEAAVITCKPKLSAIENFPIVIVTAQGVEYDYVMRLFAPAAGIPEDPVTGSAECVLGPLWSKKLHKDEFIVKQLSHRTGIKKVKVLDQRVLISGQAVTMFEIEVKL